MDRQGAEDKLAAYMVTELRRTEEDARALIARFPRVIDALMARRYGGSYSLGPMAMTLEMLEAEEEGKA